MKIGILAQYIDTRNDIRDLIMEMKKHSEICVFVHARDLVYSSLMPGVEFREIKVRSKSRLWNAFVKYVFLFFGRIPASRKNYFFAERTKLKHGNQSSFKIFEKHLSLFMTRLVSVFSYDAYLRAMQYKNETTLDDIDSVLGITEIYDDRFMSVLIKLGKPVSLYVYSWDHPCKMKTFPKSIKHYYVWNEGLEQDLVTLQHIQPEKIKKIGSTQLSYIPDYKAANLPGIGFRYYYFGCAFGYRELVEEEIDFIKRIAGELLKVDSTLKLVVRPYPFLKDWSVYNSIKALPNVHMDDRFRSTQEKSFLTHEEILEKFHWIANAEAFIHFGTTMGMEAAYFDTPIIHIAYADDKVFYNLLHQYHTDKYLILAGYPNIVRSEDELEQALWSVKKNKGDFLLYSKHVASQTGLLSMREIVSNLVCLMQTNMN
jgi:hypothetical protein